METFRIDRTTIALVLDNDRHVAHAVPVGSLVTIADGNTLNGNRLVEVIWDGRKVMMFAQDLRSRSTPVAGGQK